MYLSVLPRQVIGVDNASAPLLGHPDGAVVQAEEGSRAEIKRRPTWHVRESRCNIW